MIFYKEVITMIFLNIGVGQDSAFCCNKPWLATNIKNVWGFFVSPTSSRSIDQHQS